MEYTGDRQPGFKGELPDTEVEELIDRWPGGVPVEVIASRMGVTTERIRQILRGALVKALRQCQRRGITLADCPPPTETPWSRLERS
jgi:hypothetical protein